jgi:hypothetical protein
LPLPVPEFCWRNLVIHMIDAFLCILLMGWMARPCSPSPSSCEVTGNEHSRRCPTCEICPATSPSGRRTSSASDDTVCRRTSRGAAPSPSSWPRPYPCART